MGWKVSGMGGTTAVACGIRSVVPPVWKLCFQLFAHAQRGPSLCPWNLMLHPFAQSLAQPAHRAALCRAHRFKPVAQVATSLLASLRGPVAIGSTLLFFALTSSACVKECVSDLDCGRDEAGAEQVCSAENTCIAITPTELQSCGNNAQCDDGSIGGTGICWDGTCRYRPPCLLFDGPVHVATNCDGVVQLEETTATSNAAACTSSFSTDATGDFSVAIDSLQVFEEEQSGGRVMELRTGGVVDLCTDGQYFLYETTGFFPSCTTPAGCQVAFRPSAAGNLCDVDNPSCPAGSACVPINTIESPIGACVTE